MKIGCISVVYGAIRDLFDGYYSVRQAGFKEAVREWPYWSTFSPDSSTLSKKLIIELEGRKDNSCNHEPDQRLTALVQTNLPSWFCSFITLGLLVIKLHLNIYIISRDCLFVCLYVCPGWLSRLWDPGHSPKSPPHPYPKSKCLLLCFGEKKFSRQKSDSRWSSEEESPFENRLYLRCLWSDPRTV